MAVASPVSYRLTVLALLTLTFAIGVGSASNSPAWGSVLVEAVPRQDLVQAVALNSVGFNLARAVGPALAGMFLLFGGPALTFALNALSYLGDAGGWWKELTGSWEFVLVCYLMGFAAMLVSSVAGAVMYRHLRRRAP